MVDWLNAQFGGWKFGDNAPVHGSARPPTVADKLIRALLIAVGVGIVSAEFFKAPRFGGFRDAMDHPLQNADGIFWLFVFLLRA